jgi:hypothetical protein
MGWIPGRDSGCRRGIILANSNFVEGVWPLLFRHGQAGRESCQGLPGAIVTRANTVLGYLPAIDGASLNRSCAALPRSLMICGPNRGSASAGEADEVATHRQRRDYFRNFSRALADSCSSSISP